MEKIEEAYIYFNIRKFLKYVKKYIWIVFVCVCVVVGGILLFPKVFQNRNAGTVEHYVTVKITGEKLNEGTSEERFYTRMLWSELLSESLEMLQTQDVIKRLDEELKKNGYEAFATNLDKVTYTPMTDGVLFNTLKLSGVYEERTLYILNAYVEYIRENLGENDKDILLEVVDKSNINTENIENGIDLFSQKNIILLFASAMFGFLIIFVIALCSKTIMEKNDLFRLYSKVRLYEKEEIKDIIRVNQNEKYLIVNLGKKKFEEITKELENVTIINRISQNSLDNYFEKKENIIICIKLGETKTLEIDNILRMANIYEIKVLGCILQ